jgi:hypothetical protein
MISDHPRLDAAIEASVRRALQRREELVTVTLDDSSSTEAPRRATLAFSAIHAVYPETIMVAAGTDFASHKVVTIAIAGGGLFRVSPSEGEVVCQRWMQWSQGAP